MTTGIHSLREIDSTDTGMVREQAIKVEDQRNGAASWRCVELALDQPTEDGDTAIRLWSNLPGAEPTFATPAAK